MSHSHSSGSRLRRDVDVLLAGGQVVKSYPGTSQYSLKGVSACGLASVNVVKNVLSMERTGCTGRALVEQMMYEEFMQHAIRVCQFWTSPSHLEVEDILDIPIISRALKTVFTEYSALSYDALLRLLSNLRKKNLHDKRSVAAVLTKPPEIISVFAIYVAADKSGTTPESTIFAAFDSHSRPGEHSQGSAISFFGTETGAAAYLAQLLATDGSLLLGTSELEWQTQLLSQYSAHILMAPVVDQPLTPQESELEVFQACLRTIEAKAAYNDVKSRLDGLEEHYSKERAEKNRLQEELALVRAQLNSAVVALEAHHQAEEPPEVTSSSSKGKEKEVVPEDDEIEYVEEEWSDVGRPEADQQGATTQMSPPQTQMSPPPTQMSPPPSQMSPPPSQMSPPPVPVPQDPDEPSSSTGPAPVINSFDKDAEMAAALQMEFLEEDRLLEERFSQLLSPTQRTFDCASCLQVYLEDEVVTLARCHHVLCKPCLAKHVRQKIKDLRFPVVCLICAAERTVADPGRGVVTREIVLKLDFSPDNMKRWTELEFASLRVIAECRRCKASVIVDRGDLQAGEFVECSTRSCQNMWCKNCLQSVKPLLAQSHSCDESQDLSKRARERKWKRCPNCRNLAECNSGADVMTCRTSGCSTRFSYTTGRRLGQ